MQNHPLSFCYRIMVGIGFLFLSNFSVSANGFTLVSDDLSSGTFPAKFVANGFGCSGDNQSPSLRWSSPPKGTKSFVITMYDPDAPTGSGWWHWVIANIPAETNQIPQGASHQFKLLPTGSVSVRNDFGHNQYGGPCPPAGVHRYQFTIYALSIDYIDIAENSTAAYVGFMANAYLLAKATVTYPYQR